MTAMVAVSGLYKRFGHLLAVDDISLEVERGEILGFLGPNGSGKSTTMKMVTGFLTPSAGDIRICDIDVRSDPIVAQRHLGYLPENAPAFADIRAIAYLRFIAEIRRLGARTSQAIEQVIDRTNIGEVLHQPIDTLSKGYKRRVGLAQALLHDPDVLILDEPTDGLDPNQKHEVRTLIREIAADKAIIISTHILEEVKSVCSRALIIARGRIVADGTPEELQRRSRYHNAVSLRVPESLVEPVQSSLEALPGVSSVAASDREITAFAEGGGDILSSIAPLVREAGWPVDAIIPERGSLDEMFRSVTQADSRSQAASAAPEAGSSGSPAARGGLLADTWSVCKRELAGYFATPIAYVFNVVFLASVGAFTFFLGGFFVQGRASLESFFQFHPWLYLLLIPAIAMRLWAEERKSGSIELLLTLPITTVSAVIGKFLAAWIVAAIALALTATIWASVNYLGSPDNGAIAAGYLGSLVMAGGYLAIGAFVSAMTKNQVTAFILAATICFLFTASGLGVVLEFFSGWAPRAMLEAVANLSFLEHFRNTARGVIELRDVVFFVSTILFFLFANVVAVELRKNA